MSLQHAAQVAAASNSETARALHLISLLKGRFDALEAAIAGQDARGRLRVLMQIDDLFRELQAISLRRDAA